MTPSELPSLPSPRLRDFYRGRIEAALASLPDNLRPTILDGLGDLALALARRPTGRWFGTRDDLAALITGRWAAPEATAIVELGHECGILVDTTIPGQFRPVDKGQLIWLGARRLALTQDQDELINNRMNGALFDMFALAPALLEDADGSAGVVQLYADSPGPFEDLLELAPALAASSICWGAVARPELRMFLTERALAWTQPMGADWNRGVGTALLALECQRHEEREHLMQIAGEILTELINAALSDDTLAHEPTILATLETSLAMLAGASLKDGPGASGRDPLQEVLAHLGRALPKTHVHLLGRVLSRLLPPGDRRTESLVGFFQTAVNLDARFPIRALEGLSSPHEYVTSYFADLFEHLIASPADPDIQSRALDALEILKGLPNCPARIIPALVRLLDLTMRPDLRMAAAQLLARASEEHDFSEVTDLLEETFMDEERSPEILAGEVGVLFILGSSHSRLGPAALALIADELPPFVSQPLTMAVDLGIRAHQAHLTEMLELYAALPERPELARAIIAVAGAMLDTEQRVREQGPFQDALPMPDSTRHALLEALVPLADHGDPTLAAEATVVVAGLLPHDGNLAKAILERRAAADSPSIKAMYDLSLGINRVHSAEVIERLGRDAARGTPEISAAASVALKVFIETFEQAAALEPWLAQIRVRADEGGNPDVHSLQLLAQLATLPIGR